MAYITNNQATVEGKTLALNNSIEFSPLLNNLKGDIFQNGTPTLETPVDVNTVTGEQGIKVCGKNIFDKSTKFIGGVTCTEIETGVRATVGTAGTNKYTVLRIGGSELLGKTITVSATITPSALNNGRIRFYYLKGVSTPSAVPNSTLTSTGSKTFTLPATYPNTSYNGIAMLLDANYNGTGETGDYVDYTNLQLEFSDTATEYEPYNGNTYELNLGKNLFNSSDTNYARSDQNTITVNGDTISIVNASTSTTGYIWYNIPIEVDKTYTISYENIVEETTSSTNSLRYKLTDAPITSWTSDLTTHSTINKTNKFVTLTPTNKWLILIFASATNNSYTISNVQVEKGLQTNYAPYKTPIELCKIETNSTVFRDRIFKNKNTKNICLTDFSEWESGQYNTNGSKQDAPRRLRLKDLLPVQPDTEYYFNTFYEPYKFVLRTYDSSGTFVRSIGAVNNEATLTTSSTEYYLGVMIYNSTSEASASYAVYTELFENGEMKPFICLNSETDKSYIPHNQDWYIEKQVGKIIYTGGESWNYETGTGYARFVSPQISDAYSSTIRAKIYSNYYDYVSSGHTNGGAFLYNKKFYAYNTSYTDVDDFKTWLSTHNTDVYYPLATPTYTKITNTELLNQLNKLEYRIKFQNKITNVFTQSFDNNTILDLTYYTTENEYEDIIYSQDDHTRARIWFNDVEYEDFSRKCEKITKTSRIMPNDGKKVLTLSNFVATELELILHDVNLTDIQDQVKISIETLIDEQNETYQSIPLGVFNIQDSPVVNDNKITLKLRDNRVKFDFDYNAKPLIDAHGGSATKRQILEDICTQAGVEHEVPYFEFEDDEIGIYDDSIKATTYVAYLAEQCGCIPTITREGKLIFLDLNHLYTWRIPLSLIPKPLKVGTPFTIQRVVYEQGIIKYESSNDETLETLYINSLNPYIEDQTKINYIIEKLNGLTIDSASIQKMLGNPAIDPYDLIQVYDDSQASEPVLFTTLANNVYTFNGVNRNAFDTEIGQEQRKENVTKKTDDASFRKWATTEINNLEGTVEIQTGKITSNEEEIRNILSEFDNYATIDTVENVQNSVTQLQTDTYTKTQIQQIANGTGADGVKVTAVVSTEATFDRDGMHYSKTDAPTSSTINEKGLEVDKTSGNTELLYAGYDDDSTSATYGNSIVRTDNLTVKTYLSCANGKGRIEQFTDSNNNTGVGFFLT